jgi:UPF0755 protein
LPGRQVALEIPGGANLRRVAALMKERGVIGSAVLFRLYVLYRGAGEKLRAGRYQFNTASTPRELLDQLIKGVPPPLIKVTIPEGKSYIEVAEILAQHKICGRDKLLRTMQDVHLLRRLGVLGRTMEGFLYPDTYRFKEGTDAETVVRRLYVRHLRIYHQLRATYAKRLRWYRRRLGWGDLEIVTLASIVEKETGAAPERPRIAQVFLNRLTYPSFGSRLLQTDPAIVYGCTVPQWKSPACLRFTDRLRSRQLRDSENPYNTYVHPGLPPGPIANPGRAALEAVFVPEQNRFLYFVSRNDGTHVFSTNKLDHDRAVDRYQRQRE